MIYHGRLVSLHSAALSFVVDHMIVLLILEGYCFTCRSHLVPDSTSFRSCQHLQSSTSHFFKPVSTRH